MERLIQIGDKEVLFKATASTARRYRERFTSHVSMDIQKLMPKDGQNNGMVELSIFEQLAYTMAKQADPSIPDDPDEWLDGFDTFSVYEVMPELIALWVGSVAPMEESKKNNE